MSAYDRDPAIDEAANRCPRHHLWGGGEHHRRQQIIILTGRSIPTPTSSARTSTAAISTAERKRDLIAKLIEADPRKSDRQIAKTVKVDHKTVARSEPR